MISTFSKTQIKKEKEKMVECAAFFFLFFFFFLSLRENKNIKYKKIFLKTLSIPLGIAIPLMF
jgi:asparagine N-glycosylation enzyme membrane subunit Stt3